MKRLLRRMENKKWKRENTQAVKRDTSGNCSFQTWAKTSHASIVDVFHIRLCICTCQAHTQIQTRTHTHTLRNVCPIPLHVTVNIPVYEILRFRYNKSCRHCVLSGSYVPFIASFWWNPTLTQKSISRISNEQLSTFSRTIKKSLKLQFRFLKMMKCLKF